MGFIRRVVRSVRRAVGRVVDVGKSAFKTVTKAITDPIGTIQKVAGKILDKLPLPQVVKQFAAQFLQNPMALLALGPLAGLGGLLGSAGSLDQLFGAAQIVSQTQAFAASPQARQNAMDAFAYNQARIYFGL